MLGHGIIRLLRIPLLGLALLVFAAASPAVAGPCGVPVVIKSLADQLGLLAQRGAQPSREDLQHVDGLLATWKRHSISRDFRSAEEVQSLLAIEILVDEAEAALDPNRDTDPGRIANAIEALRMQDQRDCPDTGSETDEDGLYSTGGTPTARLSAVDSDLWPFFTPGALRRTGVLFSTLIGLISAIVLSSYAYDLVISLRFNRRSCHIHATLEFDLDVVDGAITILGRKGCRFTPVNAGARARLGGLAAKDPVVISVGLKRYRARVEQFSRSNLGIYFDKHLSRAEQALLLKASLVSPHLAPRSHLSDGDSRSTSAKAARAS